MAAHPRPDNSAVALRAALDSGALTATALARATLERIDALDGRLHAWTLVDRAGLLRAAQALDAGGGARGLLAGLPVGVKDIIDVAGLPTGCGSPVYEGVIAPADAACVAAARAAGALFPGKTVTTEFAYFSPGPTANPHNPAHTPGGSSSGSAAAVAAGMVPLAFGTQTAGSLIRPASFCGVFALKPTFGTVAMHGIKPFARSLDTLGWFARSAEDLALMRCALAGQAWQPLAVPAAGAVRLGVCRTHEWPAIDPAGAAAFDTAARLAAAHGLRLREQVLPPAFAGLVEAQKTVMAHEAAQALETEDRLHSAQLSAPLRLLLETGKRVADADRRAALQRAEAARAALGEVFQDVDALLVPAAPGEAPAGLGGTGDPVFCRVWTLLGLPCVNVPGLRGPQGLPIGMQLVAPAGEDDRLIAIAARLAEALAPR